MRRRGDDGQPDGPSTADHQVTAPVALFVLTLADQAGLARSEDRAHFRWMIPLRTATLSASVRSDTSNFANRFLR